MAKHYEWLPETKANSEDYWWERPTAGEEQRRNCNSCIFSVRPLAYHNLTIRLVIPPRCNL